METIYLTIFFCTEKGGYPIDTVQIRHLKEFEFHMDRFKKWCKEENKNPLDGKYMVKEHAEFPEKYVL